MRGELLALGAVAALAAPGLARAGSASKDAPGREREQRELIEAARRFQRERFGCAPHSACLYEAVSLIAVAAERGRKLHLVAGTAQWERMRPDQDDGVSPTHFGYVWEPGSPATMARLAAGLMPEMHVWAVDPKTEEYIDPTAREFPVQARLIAGLDWPGTKPPDFLWARYDALPRKASYKGDALASRLAAELITVGLRG